VEENSKEFKTILTLIEAVCLILSIIFSIILGIDLYNSKFYLWNELFLNLSFIGLIISIVIFFIFSPLFRRSLQKWHKHKRLIQAKNKYAEQRKEIMDKRELERKLRKAEKVKQKIEKKKLKDPEIEDEDLEIFEELGENVEDLVENVED
jgi:uncharacterized membrane protein